ncbi:MAG: helix-turn-helix domain-containing protein [Deltaproteobacteria bacterium]|nr:helix-turn-helix domain-containing protein [Deltaproteobacteria bacterium]
MGHLIAAAIYDGLRSFEYSIAKEVLGSDRRELTPNWYRFLPCRVEPGRLSSSHGLDIEPPGRLDDLESADTILICGWRNPQQRPPDAFLEALRGAAQRGARLVSICSGVFALAHAGLLDGRKVTTHWLYEGLLKEAFPRLEIEANALYFHDSSPSGSLWTSSGGAAGFDLSLALIREDFGLAIANEVAKRMVAPIHRDGAQSQYISTPAGISDNEPFGPVLDWMVTHLDENLTVQVIARRFAFSIRTFQRRFKEMTGQSPHQWLVGQRVARACELLELTGKSVEHVATLSGLGSAANLRKHFAQHVASTPRAYRSCFRSGSSTPTYLPAGISESSAPRPLSHR